MYLILLTFVFDDKKRTEQVNVIVIHNNTLKFNLKLSVMKCKPMMER